MAAFDIFGQMPIANVEELRRRRMMPADNIGEVGPSGAWPAMTEQNIGEVGPMPSGLSLPAVPVRERKTGMLPGKPFTDRLQPMEGEIIPPGRKTGPGGLPLQTPRQDYELPMTRDRQMKRGLAMALLSAGTTGQRVQGLQLLAETQRPTKEEADVIERNRLLGVIDTADVDEATRARARLGVQIGAQPKDVLEVLGFDAQGKKAAEGKKDEILKTALKTASEAVPQGVIERSANRIYSLLDNNKPGFGNFATGTRGYGLSYVPGTDAYQMDKELSTIKAIIGFDRLQQMREQSKTGGALGQVSNIELMFLQSVQGSLDQFQDPDVLRRNVGDIVASRKLLNQMHALTPLLDAGDPGAIQKFGEIAQQLSTIGDHVQNRSIDHVQVPGNPDGSKFERMYGGR